MLVNLRALGRHSTADAAVAWAAAQPVPLPANQPKVYQGRVVLPGDEGYEVALDDVSQVDRDAFERAFIP